MLALPSAWANQYDGDSGITDKLVADFLTNGISRKGVVNVSVSNRLIYEFIAHSFYKGILIVLVFAMETDESLVAGNLCHIGFPG